MIWYVNVARLLVQGIIPFVSLSFLNYRIYWVMKRRQNMVNRPLVAPKPNNLPPNNIPRGGNNATTILTARQKKANEAQQAVVLFVIVLLFFLCHSLRFGLNVHEFFNLKDHILIYPIPKTCLVMLLRKTIKSSQVLRQPQASSLATVSVTSVGRAFKPTTTSLISVSYVKRFNRRPVGCDSKYDIHVIVVPNA